MIGIALELEVDEIDKFIINHTIPTSKKYFIDPKYKKIIKLPKFMTNTILDSYQLRLTNSRLLTFGLNQLN